MFEVLHFIVAMKCIMVEHKTFLLLREVNAPTSLTQLEFHAGAKLDVAVTMSAPSTFFCT